MALTDPFSRFPKPLAKLPRLVRLYICHCVIGFGIAGVLTGLVLTYNFAGIGHLVANVDGGWLAGFIFFMFNGSVFAAVQTAIVIMSMEYDDDDDTGGHRPPPLSSLVPIPVERKPRRR